MRTSRPGAFRAVTQAVTEGVREDTLFVSACAQEGRLRYLEGGAAGEHHLVVHPDGEFVPEGRDLLGIR